MHYLTVQIIECYMELTNLSLPSVKAALIINKALAKMN